MIALILFTLVLAPTYTLRFSLAKYPTNLLMVWVFLVWVFFTGYLLTKKLLPDFIYFVKSINKQLLAPTLLFFLAGIISLFYPSFDQKKLGQFIVLFLHPISLFFITGFTFHKNPESKRIILYTLYFILAAFGLYAILQYFTRVGLPATYWGNANEPKRALSFFTHPNFYALFSSPLLAFLVPDAVINLKTKILNLKSLAWLLGAIGLLLSLSRGGWLALVVAAALYVIIAADKKIKQWFLGAIIILLVIVLSVPNFRYRILLPFMGEKSTVSRFSLLDTGWKMAKDSPILGKGLTGFDRKFAAYNTDPGLDHLDFPHNIFLNFWIDTGLLGLISFLGILIYAWWNGLKNKNDTYKFSFALFCAALLIHGLIDVPYLKNDLAIIFWMLISLTI